MAKKVQYIKVAKIDQNGNDLTNTLESLTQITIPLTSAGNKTYKILTRSDFSTYYLFQVDLNNTPDAATLPSTTSTTLDYQITASLDDFTTGSSSIIGRFNLKSLVTGGQTLTDFYNLEQQWIEINTIPKKDLHFSIGRTAPGQTFQATLDISDVDMAESASVEFFQSSQPYTTFTQLTNNQELYRGDPIQNITRSISISKANITPGDIIFLGVKQEGIIGLNNLGALVSLNNPGGAKFTGKLYVTSSAAQGPQLENIVEPYLSKKFTNSDCEVLINNVDQYQNNPFLQDLDYSTNPLVPVNYNQVITGTAQKAKVPQSHYTMNNIINPNYNSSNITLKYNVDNSSYTSQVSAGCFVAYWKTLFSSENVANQKYYAVASLKYLISPDEELLEINSEPEMVGLIRQLYGSNANSISHNPGTANFFGEPNIFRNTSISFSNTGSNSIGTLLTSDNEASNYTGFSYVVPFAGTVNILLYTSSSFSPNPLGTDSDGGLLFPTDISLTTHATLPARARQILTENNVIPPQK